MPDESSDPNLLANVSLGLAIVLVVLWFVGMIIGCIPVIGLLSFLLYPVNILLAVAAIATGAMGYQRSKDLDGRGAVQALMGAGTASMWTAFQLFTWCMMCGAGGLLVLTDNL